MIQIDEFFLLGFSLHKKGKSGILEGKEDFSEKNMVDR